jgi:hypothetical protein
VQVKESEKDELYQRWAETLRQQAKQRDLCGDKACIRVNNGRYAKDATFEEQLSEEDRNLLSEMGIAV